MIQKNILYAQPRRKSQTIIAEKADNTQSDDDDEMVLKSHRRQVGHIRTQSDVSKNFPGKSNGRKTFSRITYTSKSVDRSRKTIIKKESTG